jgi:hypothetical protein
MTNTEPNRHFEGWPILTRENGEWIVRTAHAEGRYETREEAERGMDLWLRMKHESEQPPRSLADKLADAIEAALEDKP